MIEQLLLDLGINVTANAIIEGLKLFIKHNPDATESEVKAEISHIAKTDKNDDIEKIYNLILDDNNIVIGHGSSAKGKNNIIIGHNRHTNGSNNIFIG